MARRIAIVGIGLRAPGADTPDSLWKVLVEGRETTTAIPKSRFDASALMTGDLDNRLACDRGGFIDRLEFFDADFFGLSQRDAESLDPGARQLLQVAWETFEDAGIKPSSVRQKRVGTYVGAMASDYEKLAARTATSDLGDLVGRARNGYATRLSYQFELTGPSVVVDTDRSSSLVALDMAARDLGDGRIDAALVCGVNVILSAETSLAFSRAGLLSGQGRCSFGDASADGIVRSEAVVCVLLKPLDLAERDGDRIYAVVRSTRVNHDGARSHDYLTPSVSAQRELVLQALAAADLRSEDIGYVEAHGTGTPVGDATELAALAEVFSGVSHPVFVGSIKSNVGHCEASAGLLGVVKAALTLQRGVIPKTLHVQAPTPKVAWATSALQLALAAVDWPADLPKRACVSSFGLTGTNAHCVLETAPAMTASVADDRPGRQIVLLSASDEAGILRVADKLAAVANLPPLATLSAALLSQRERLPWRLHGMVGSTQELRAELSKFVAGDATGSLQLVKALQGPKIVFVCPGQGSQWIDMIAALVAISPAAAAQFAAIDAKIMSLSGWSLGARTREGEDWLTDGVVVQHALFASAIVLAGEWDRRGVKPDLVIGTSVGELAACVISGVYTIDDALGVLSVRARLMSSMHGAGGLLAVDAPLARVKDLLAATTLDVAAENGPTNIVVGGSAAELGLFAKTLATHAIATHPVKIDVPSHTRLMQPVAGQLQAQLGWLTERPLPPLMRSTVHPGKDCLLDARYWADNLRQQIRLRESIAGLTTSEALLCVELSPHPVLLAPLADCLAERAIESATCPSMTRTSGFDVSLAPFIALGGEWTGPSAVNQRATDLPRYPFASRQFPLKPSGDSQPAPTSNVKGPDSPPAAADTFGAVLRETPLNGRASLLVTHITDLARAVTRFPRTKIVPVDRGWRDLGLTSLMMVELRNRLAKSLARALPTTFFFDHATIQLAAEHLATEAEAPGPTSLLGDILVECGVVRRDQIDLALAQQRRDERLGEVLMRLGFVTPLQLQRALTTQLAEPIAIVGVGLRFPGGVSSMEDYWNLLASGRDAITGVPQERWQAADAPDVPPWGGFISGAYAFDYEFFGISRHEAEHMDPQQRLLLQVSWHALEHAAIDPSTLRDTQAGVFIGVSNYNDYARLKEQTKTEVTAFDGVGDATSIIAGRLSYHYGFHGPALSVDTACSSSLVALHLACQSLKNLECQVALAGAVNVILTPHVSEAFARSGMLAPDGRCKTFDAGANGYVRSEGCAVVVLKRLSDAIRNQDRILALIGASVVNQDGRSAGLTAPSGEAQERLLRSALTQAGVGAADVAYVDAHGTGTRLGDPIELGALARVYGEGRPAARPLLVGSAKTNLGHLEAAAGMAGLLKVVAALQHDCLPPSLHLNKLNPAIDWAQGAIGVVSHALPWPKAPRRLAGVSAFGFSGTNAHVLLEAPVPRERIATLWERPAHPFLFSAPNDAALTRTLAAWLAYLQRHPAASLGDLAHTLACGRTRFPCRVALTASSREELMNQLSQPLAVPARDPSPVIGWFPTSSHTHPLQGLQLYVSSPIYRSAYESYVEALESNAGENLVPTLFDSAERLSAHSRILLSFASSLGLFDVWGTWGANLATVGGDGVGVITSALAAGVIDLRAACLSAIELARLLDGGPASEGDARLVVQLSSDRSRWSLRDDFGAEATLQDLVARAAFGEQTTLRIAPSPQALVLGSGNHPMASLERGAEWQSMCRAVGELFLRESDFSFAEFDAPYQYRTLDGVTYPFLAPTVLPVAGFERDLSAQSPAYLRDHQIFGELLFPAAGYLALLADAASAAGLATRLKPTSIMIERGLFLRDAPTRVRVALDVSAGSAEISSDQGDGEWLRHVSVELGMGRDETGADPAFGADVSEPAPTPHAVAALYSKLAALGLAYGPHFRTLSALVPGDGQMRFAVSLQDDASDHALHPALVDGCLQAALALVTAPGAYLPIAFEDVHWSGSLGARATGVATRGAASPDGEVERFSVDVRFATGRLQFVLVAKRAEATAIAPDHRAELLYEQVWVPSAHRAPARPFAHVLVIGDLLAAPITRALRAHGGAVEQTTLQAALQGTPISAQLIVVVASIEEPMSAVAAYLAFVQKVEAGTEVVFVTERAQSVQREAVKSPEQAMLWGLGRVVQTERPELRLRLLDAERLGPEADAIAAECLAEPRGSEVAFRGELRFEAVVQPLHADGGAITKTFQIHGEGAYVVTGGLGGLGLQLAGWLCDRGAKRLYLCSRNPPDPAALGVIERLCATGARVEAESLDVGDRAAVLAFATRLHAQGIAVRGVVHAAGRLADAPLATQSADSLRAVLTPKVLGAKHVREAFGANADWLMYFSSIAALIGSAGQANYAAANAYLDALACNGDGKQLSLQWGPWAEVGMAARVNAQVTAQLEQKGLQPLAPTTALAMLDAAIAAATPVVAVASIDWRKAAKLAAVASKSKLAPLLERAGIRPGGERRGKTSDVLSDLPPAQRGTQVERWVLEAIAKVASSAGAAADQPLKELGFDSLMAIELRNNLAAFFEVKLPATLAFDYPTAREIAGYLLPLVSEATKPAPTTRRAAARASEDEPIAIVAMACRYPGAVKSPEDLWALIDTGGDGIEVFPPERWDAEALYDANPDAAGKTYCKEGGFLHGIETFDATFFGISPKEASSMDPQQRLLLETSNEALERAGMVPGALGDRVTGVYVGLMYHDFGVAALSDPKLLDGYVVTGTGGSVASGRISYAFGLQGPSMTVDTACSSSLVTVHLAVQALRGGECDVALAGGVTVMSTPSTFVEFSRLRGLSKDGRCKSFSEQADGVGWGEGCGMLVLKRLSDARLDGDRVLGVVRGSAVNQDGRSNGLTAPNGPSQQRVIESALQRAGLTANDIDFIEGHGTGTTLGDPIEAGALSAVFGAQRSRQAPVYLGSIKSNIGHTQAAAGVAGIIKVVLALQHERMPRSLYSEQPSSHVRWAGSGVALLSEARPWHRSGQTRRAGVSSFGISGTNAHVIIEEAPERTVPKHAAARPQEILCISAPTDEALRLQAERWRLYLRGTNETLRDIAFTALVHRKHFERRLAFAATDNQDAQRKLDAFLAGKAIDGVHGGSDAELQAAVVAGGVRVEIPTYAFLRKRYWAEDAARLGSATPASGYAFLGAETALATDASTRVFTTEVSEQWPAWLQDHRVQGQVVMPAAGFVELMLEAAKHVLGTRWVSLEDVEIELPLIVHGAQQLQLVVSDERRIEIYGRAKAQRGAWALYARGRMSAAPAAPASMRTLSEYRAAVAQQPAALDVYPGFAEVGLHYGALFQTLTHARIQANEALSDLHSVEGTPSFVLSPMVLDGCLQTMALLMRADGDVYLPVGFERCIVGDLQARHAHCHAHLREGQAGVDELIKGDLSLFDAAGQLVAQVQGAKFKRARTDAIAKQAAQRHLYELQWRVVPMPGRPTEARAPVPRWLVVGEETERGVSQAFADALTARGLQADVCGPQQLNKALDGEAPMSVLWVVPHADDTDEHVRLERVMKPLLPAMQTLAKRSATTKLVVLTERAQPVGGELVTRPWHSGVWGAVRVLGSEHPELLPKLIDVSDYGSAANELSWELFQDGDEDEVGLYHGRRYAQRLVRQQQKTLSVPQAANYALQIPKRGRLDALTLRAVPEQTVLAEHTVEVCVEAVGLNFRDVLNALGMYPGDPGPLGGDFAGAVRRVGTKVTDLQPGDRVYGLALGALQRYVIADARLVSKTASALSDEQAATLVSTFLTAKYALEDVARVTAHARVLIHSAAGGVGQAAVQIAKRLGAEIFATASRSKHAFLRAQGIKHVYDSRDTSFYAGVLSDTQNEGVDVVLNALTGDKLHKSVQLLRAGGRFLEIGKTELLNAEQVKAINDKASYTAVALDEMAVDKPEWFAGAYADLNEQLAKGVYASLPLETHAITDAREAFLRMAQGKSIGKVVLRMTAGSTAPRHAVKTDGAYVVSGGLGAIGREVGVWLAEQGAKDIVLLGRGAATPEANEAMARMRSRGAQVTHEQVDVTNAATVAAALDRARSRRGRIAGVLHAAGVLRDATLAEQSWDKFLEVLAPKVIGALVLKRLAPEAEYFGSFGSIAAIIGNGGQLNYAAANAFLDGLAHSDASGNSQTIDWWAWAGVGMAADLAGRRGAVQFEQALSLSEGLSALALAMQTGGAQVIVAPIDLAEASKRRTVFARSAKFSDWVARAPRPERGSGEETELVRQLKGLSSDGRVGLVQQRVLLEIQAALATDEPVPVDKPLMDFGVDSLVAVELRNRLSGLIGQTLPSSFVFDYPRIEAIAKALIALAIKTAPPPAAPREDRLVAQVATLSQAQVAAETESVLDELLSQLAPKESKNGR